MNNDILPGFDDEHSDSLSIELIKVGGIDSCLAFSLSGQIDAYSSLFFQRMVKKAIDAGFTHLRFLLSSVDYVSSMGVGALVQLQQTLKGKGGDIAIVGVQPKVMEVFRLMCLEKFFRCTESPEESADVRESSESLPHFPRALTCPVCRKRLRAVKPGRFRCPACRAVLHIDDVGLVSAV